MFFVETLLPERRRLGKDSVVDRLQMLLLVSTQSDASVSGACRRFFPQGVWQTGQKIKR